MKKPVGVTPRPIVLDETSTPVRLVLRASQSAAALQEAATSVLAAQERHGVTFRFDSGPTRPERDGEFEDWHRHALHGFLDDTQLVLAGGDLLVEAELVDAQGNDRTPTWRQWGGWIAEWANDRWYPFPGRTQGTHARPGEPWEYIDFYMGAYLEDLVEQYPLWAKNALEVLKAADALRDLGG